MADCDKILTLTEVEETTQDARVLKEVVTSTQDETERQDSSGNTHYTLKRGENIQERAREFTDSTEETFEKYDGSGTQPTVTGLVNETRNRIGQAVSENGLTPLDNGVYATGKTYTAYNQYLIFTSDGSKWLVKSTVDLTSGYTTTQADPNNDTNLRLFNEIDERKAVSISKGVTLEKVGLIFDGVVSDGVKQYWRDVSREITYFWSTPISGEITITAQTDYVITATVNSETVYFYSKDVAKIPYRQVTAESFGASPNREDNEVPINEAIEYVQSLGGGEVIVESTTLPTTGPILGQRLVKLRSVTRSGTATIILCNHSGNGFTYKLGSWMSTGAGIYGFLFQKGSGFEFTGIGAAISDTYGFEVKCNFDSFLHPIALLNNWGWTEGTIIETQCANTYRGILLAVPNEGGTATNSFGYTQIRRAAIFFNTAQDAAESFSSGLELGEYGNSTMSAIGGYLYNSTINMSIWGRANTKSIQFADNFYMSNCEGSILNESSTSITNALYDFENVGKCGFFGLIPNIINSSGETDDDGLLYPEEVTCDGIYKRVHVYNRFQAAIWVKAVTLYQQSGVGNYGTFIGQIRAMGNRSTSDAAIADFIVRYGASELGQVVFDVKGECSELEMQVVSVATDAANTGNTYEVWFKIPQFSANWTCEYTSSKRNAGFVTADGLSDAWVRYAAGELPTDEGGTLVYDSEDRGVPLSEYTSLSAFNLTDADFAGLTLSQAWALFDAFDKFHLSFNMSYATTPNLCDALGLTSGGAGALNSRFGVLEITKPSNAYSRCVYTSAEPMGFMVSSLQADYWYSLTGTQVV